MDKKTTILKSLIWKVLPIIISFGSLVCAIIAYNYSKQVDEDRNRPFFKFDIVPKGSSSFLKLEPLDNDIIIQKAKYILSENIYHGWTNLQVEQPDYLLYLGDFYDFINKQEDRKEKMSNYKDFISDNGDTIRYYYSITTSFNIAKEIPFGLTIEYVQFGKVKTINGLYSLQYKQSYDENENKQYKITGVVFKKYFESLKELESIISSTKITKTKAK